MTKLIGKVLLLFMIAITLIIGMQRDIWGSRQTFQPIKAETDLENDIFGNYNYFVSFGDYKYIISSKGSIEIRDGTEIRNVGELYNHDEYGDYILTLFYATYQGDLILLYNISNMLSGGGRIIRIKGRTIAKVWEVPIFNISESVIEDNNVYVVNPSSVAKLDLDTGKIIWKRDDIKQMVGIEKLEGIKIKSDVIELIYEGGINGKTKNVVVRLNKFDGKEL